MSNVCREHARASRSCEDSINDAKRAGCEGLESAGCRVCMVESCFQRPAKRFCLPFDSSLCMLCVAGEVGGGGGQDGQQIASCKFRLKWRMLKYESPHRSGKLIVQEHPIFKREPEQKQTAQACMLDDPSITLVRARAVLNVANCVLSHRA